jgi:hypothetical protein
MVQKRFKNEIWIFSKRENNLGFRNKNMHAMKCNLSNYSKFFLLLFKWNTLTWQVLNFSEYHGVTWEHWIHLRWKLIIVSEMGWGCKGEPSLIKNDVSGDLDAISGKIKAPIPFVVRGIADEDTPARMRNKLMRAYRKQVGESGRPKNPELLIGRRCVV